MVTKETIRRVVEFIVLARQEWSTWADWNGTPTTLAEFKEVATEVLKDRPDNETMLFILTIKDDDELEKILLLA